MSAKRIPVQKRKEIFLALVAAQDTRTMTVSDSMRQVRDDHKISGPQLEEIIDEGVEKNWLEEGVVAA